MAVNHKPQLSPTVYTNLQGYVEFKANFHHVSIRAWKDPAQKWYDLPYLAMDDVIDAVLDQWPTEWRTTTDLAMGGSKYTTQRKKEEAKIKMTQLAEKRKKEATEKAQAERKAVQTEKKTGGTERGSHKGARSPSPETEEETEEQHGVDPQETSSRIKRPREPEKEGSRKKSKATKTSLDPITLTEGDLHDIDDKVRDVTTDALQQFEQQQQIILGAIHTSLQELQTCISQTGTMSTSLAISTSEAVDMLHAKASRAIVLPDGALTTENEADKPTVSAIKGVGLNLAALHVNPSTSYRME